MAQKFAGPWDPAGIWARNKRKTPRGGPKDEERNPRMGSRDDAEALAEGQRAASTRIQRIRRQERGPGRGHVKPQANPTDSPLVLAFAAWGPRLAPSDPDSPQDLDSGERSAPSQLDPEVIDFARQLVVIGFIPR